MDLRPSRTNPSICINQTRSAHLPRRQTWGHTVSSFKFSNHTALCHLACSHESIASPWSSQCRMPPWRAHINQSHRPDLVSVVRPHGIPPQINSIAPIQSCAPMACPHNSIPSPTSNKCRTPIVCPHKSIPFPRSNCAPPWRVPINQCHRPIPASVAHPHKSIPSPRSSQCREPPWIKAIAPIQPGSLGPMARPYESIPSPWSSQCRMPPWRTPMNHSHRPDPASVARPHGATPPINAIILIQSRTPMTHPHKSIPSPRSSPCCMPPWHTPINQSHYPDPASVVYPHGKPPWINLITPFHPVPHTAKK